MKRTLKLGLLYLLVGTCNIAMAQRADNTSRSWEINDLDWGIESGHDDGSTQSQIILDGENDTGGSILLQAGDGPQGAGNITLGYPDNGSILFQQNGATLMTLTNSGIGIGNSNPGQTLDITGNMNITGNIFQNNELLDFSGLWSQNNDNIFFNSGNVGIGNDNPAYKLDVNGDIRFTGNLFHGDTQIKLSEGMWATEDGNKIIKSSGYIKSSISLTEAEAMGYGDDIVLTAGNGYYASGKITFITNSYLSGFNSRMTFADGRLGIGTSEPAYSLDIKGDIRLTGNLYSGDNLIDLAKGTWDIEGNDKIIRAQTSQSMNVPSITLDGVDNAGVGGHIILHAGGGYYGDGDVKFKTQDGEMTFHYGKLGIGTSTPDQLLHLKSNTHTYLKVESNENNKEAGIMLTGRHVNNTATSKIYMDYYGETGHHGLNYLSGRNGFANHWFKDNDSNIQMVIKDNGNVGIGTTSPDVKLEVNGRINCEGIEVKNVAADHVFNAEYKLRTLEEVEAFIKDKGHLPDVAPASETVKGVELSEFNTLLLQKIEELTLYVIEIKKENAALKETIDQIK